MLMLMLILTLLLNLNDTLGPKPNPKGLLGPDTLAMTQTEDFDLTVCTISEVQHKADWHNVLWMECCTSCVLPQQNSKCFGNMLARHIVDNV